MQFKSPEKWKGKSKEKRKKDFCQCPMPLKSLVFIVED